MTRLPMIARIATCLALTLAATVAGPGRTQEPTYDGHRRTSFYVTVRDGTKLVIWNSRVVNTGMASLTTATKATLATIHPNTAYFNGGVSDIAFENSNDDVSRIDHVPVFYGVMKEAGHAATYAHVNGGTFGEVGANWLLWRLKGHTAAGAMFDGPQCGLCTDAAWTVQKKRMR